MNSELYTRIKPDESDPLLLETAQFSEVQAALPVAQYVRMSTEFQCYSTLNQMHAMAAYARTHGMVIVRSQQHRHKPGGLLGQVDRVLNKLPGERVGRVCNDHVGA